MIITVLSWAVVLAAFFQVTKERKIAALCFAAPVAFSELTYINVTGELYYYYSSLLAMIIVFLLRYIAKPCKFTLHLLLICIVAIAGNLMGWAIYRLKFAPDVYEWFFIGLYLVTLWQFLPKGWSFVGFNRMDNGCSSLSRDGGAVYQSLRDNQG